MFSPRDLILTALNEALETGVAYLANIDEMNRHTPFREPIHSSNLCLEICEPTRPYQDMRDLYSNEEVGFVEAQLANGDTQRFVFSEAFTRESGELIFAGLLEAGDVATRKKDGKTYTIKEILEVYAEPEIALCSLGALNYDAIDEDDDEAYEEAMYLTLKMIDYCILNSDYVLPHVEVTA